MLGGSVRLVGAVGGDAAGAKLVAEIARRGVDVSSVRCTDAPTGEAIVVVDDEGANSIVVSGGANLTLSADAVDHAHPESRIFVTGFEVPDEVVEATAARADAHGCLLVLNPSPVRDISPGMMAARSLVIVNEIELSEIAAGTPTGADGLHLLSRDLRHASIVMTRGAAGCLVYDVDADAIHDLPGQDVHAVDTSGCGDAFVGALVARLAEGATLRESAEFANMVGAFAATRSGTQDSYPTMRQLDKWSAGRRPVVG
jgi:ribokinase